MKKILLLGTSIVLSIAAFSQLSFGLQGVGNLSDAQIKDVNDLDNRKKMKAMPGAGIVVQYDINENFAIRSGVNYQQNGVTLKATLDETFNLKVELENTLHYIQVPLNVLYLTNVSLVKFFAGAGGYINYGVNGTTKSVLSYTMPDGHEFVEKEEFKAFEKEENGGANLKQIDYGISTIAGIQLVNGVFVNVGYQYGLSNISRGEGSYKNRGLQLTIGYFFLAIAIGVFRRSGSEGPGHFLLNYEMN